MHLVHGGKLPEFELVKPPYLIRIVLLYSGKGPDNTWLHCVSGRMVHPTKTVPNEMGRMETVVLPFCNYHVKECVGDHSEQDPASVLVPNFEGLCTECHLDTLHSRPTPMRYELTLILIHVVKHDHVLHSNNTQYIGIFVELTSVLVLPQ